MEKLILTCGRFVPATGEGEAARLKGMEDYLSRLTEELELLLSEVGRALDRSNDTGEEG